MTKEELHKTMQQIEERLEILKSEDPSEYERLLRELVEALEEFNQDLQSLT